MEASAELHRRKIFAGIAMIAAPLLMGAAYMVGPEAVSDTVAGMQALAADPGAAEVGMVLYVGALLLFVYATFGVVHLLREQRPWLSQIGGLLAVTGLILVGVVNGVYLAALEAAQLDVATAAAMMEAVEANPVALLAFTGTLFVPVGFVVLAVGLLRSQTAPAWSGWLLAIGIVVQTIGDFASSNALSLVGITALVLALVPLGYQLLVEPDEAWEHPARFTGFRPAVGAR